MRKLRIGLFGGSFNPVHNGHIRICKAFLSSNLIDELWIIPVYDPPHKSTGKLLSFLHRFEMVRIAFSEMSKVSVVDIEKDLPKPNFTLNTVNYLKSIYPDATFLLCLGGDSLKYFETWYEYKALLKLVQLLIVDRENINFDDVDSAVLNRTTFIRNEITPESSSEIRDELISTGTTIQIPVEVLNYIRKNKLYTSDSN